MLQQSQSHGTTPLSKNRVSFKQWLLCCIYSIRLRVAYLALRLAVLCHKQLTNLLNLVCPELPESKEPDSEASYASWTPTTQAVFAVVPPDHEIRGPGEMRKLRR